MSNNPDELLEKATTLFDNVDYNACIDFIEKSKLSAGKPELTIEQREQLHFLMGDSLFFWKNMLRRCLIIKEVFRC